MFNTLLDALSDPDLADIAPNLQPQAMQSLYISTGCDYVSFLQALVRLASCQHFQYASFIAGGIDPPGSIGDFFLIHSHHPCSLFSAWWGGHTLENTLQHLNCTLLRHSSIPLRGTA